MPSGLFFSYLSIIFSIPIFCALSPSLVEPERTQIVSPDIEGQAVISFILCVSEQGIKLKLTFFKRDKCIFNVVIIYIKAVFYISAAYFGYYHNHSPLSQSAVFGRNPYSVIKSIPARFA